MLRQMLFAALRFIVHAMGRRPLPVVRDFSRGGRWSTYDVSVRKKIRGKMRSSVGSALACCKAGPSSNLGSVPQGGFAH
jgi:hypothetical protein